MPGEAHLPYTLAAICAVGGVMGFVKTKSTMSLVAGAGIGGLYALSGLLLTQGEGEKGHALGFGTSLVLGSIMAKRFNKTRKMMPAGTLALVGSSAAVWHGLKYWDWKKW